MASSSSTGLRRVAVITGHATVHSETANSCVGVTLPQTTEVALSTSWFTEGLPTSVEASALPLVSNVSSDNAQFRARQEHSRKLLEKLEQALTWARRGGGEKYVQLHRKRGKLLPRERIQKVVDPGTEILEISALAGIGRYNDEVPSGGYVLAIGIVHGRECVFLCHDATVKGGAFFMEGVKKQDRGQAIAALNHLPCIYFVDGGGAKLDAKEGTSNKIAKADSIPTVMFVLGGKTFKMQAKMSALKIPQVALVCGMCTAGGAYTPAMCDESVIVKGNGTVYLGGPPLVKAATGEDADEQELGGGVMHTSVSGVVDHLASTEEEGLQKVRAILEHLAGRTEKQRLLGIRAREAPLYSTEELLGLIPEDPADPLEMLEVIARIVDGSRFHAFKPHFDKALLCGFAHLDGYPVGIVTSMGFLNRKSAVKAAHFVQICGQRFIPLIFLHNSQGFVCESTQDQAGVLRDVGWLLATISCVAVPKLSVVCGGSQGDCSFALNGPSFDPRFLWLWPNATVTLPLPSAPVVPAIASTSGVFDDGVIDPRDTRKVLSMGISICLNAPRPESSYGVLRM